MYRFIAVDVYGRGGCRDLSTTQVLAFCAQAPAALRMTEVGIRTAVVQASCMGPSARKGRGPQDDRVRGKGKLDDYDCGGEGGGAGN
jgi:hypothetical protein